MIKIAALDQNKGMISCDVPTMEVIRNYFSIANPAHGKAKNRFVPTRLYSITPGGTFDLGLTEDLKAYLESNQMPHEIHPLVFSYINCGYENGIVTEFSSKTYREHQAKSIKKAVDKGRGVIVIPTAGGKTLIMAGIIQSMNKNANRKLKTLVIVPSIQLVEQTASDFEEYGLTGITKWSGNNTPDPKADIFVAGTQILLSEKSDLSELSEIDLLLIDEVHGLRKGNEINKIIKYMKTNNRFGFTGTMPPSMIDQWNIIGKIGPILYEEKTLDLKDKKYVSDFKIVILNVLHKDIPKFTINYARPAEQYNKEIEFLLSNQRRNEIIAKLANRLSNNTIIMVDRIEHGVNIESELKKINPERPIYFIQGSTEMVEREKVRSLMEERNDVIAVAVSKIFSTGINIPNLHNIIFATAGKAKIKIMQSIGRALRLHPTKTAATIFDIADNTKYGKIHVKERIKLYEKEKYTYETKNI